MTVLRGGVARTLGVALAALIACWSCASAWGEEIYSNAAGGGEWSDPATWRGGAVPGPEDVVILARDDSVTFDRNDEGQATCRKLLLDPQSVLEFKTGAGPIVLTVNGLVESYGTIRLDATRAAADRHELRLVSPDSAQRVLRMGKGGGLVAAGRASLTKGRRNALLSSLPPLADPTLDPSAVLEAGPGTTLDLARIELVNMYVQATSIDNTGAKPGERINLVRNRFSGTSRVSLNGCDTPLVADNLFEREGTPPLQQPAIYLSGCPLAELRGNTIRGTYAGGITGYGQPQASVSDTLIENCPSGLYWYGADAMIRRLTIRNCNHGMTLTSASGALEDVTIEGCLSGYHHGGAVVQATNLVIRDMQAGSLYNIYFGSGPLTLINSPIKPEQIKFDPGFPQPPVDDKPRPPAVQALEFLIVRVSGDYPPGSTVAVRTTAAPSAPDAADQNVRNSPAPVLSSGYTPLPKTLEPLIVRSWMIDADGKLAAAPEYQLEVLAPVLGPGEVPQVLKAITVTPKEEWFRPEPNEKRATLEVMLP
jgi:hypothetical protein